MKGDDEGKPSSSAEKTTKSRTERVEKDRDTNGGADIDPGTKVGPASNQSGGSSRSKHKKPEPEELQKKTMMENTLKQQQDEGKQNEVVAEEETAENAKDTENTSLSEAEPEEASDATTETETQTDTDPTPPEKIPEAYPVYDSDDGNNDDSVIDLDSGSITTTSGSEPTVVVEKETKDDDQSQPSSSVVDDGNESDIGADNTTNTDNNTTPEFPTTSTVNEYNGEPWGHYRSTRRLPDMELLQLVFENSKAGKTRSSGDTKSKEVLDGWKKDPLYEENITVEDDNTEQPMRIDDEEVDQQFLEYRSRLFGSGDKNGAAAVASTANQKSKTRFGIGGDSTKDETQDTQVKESSGKTNESDDNNQNTSTSDVHSEFVEGLDDIDDFFEGVDPPDELDVGYGSSIQDVLMDKGKQILLKKVRGAGRWIQIGWQTLARKAEERISQLQLPFLNAKTSSDSDGDDKKAMDSSTSKTATSSDHSGRKEPNVRENIVSVWKTGTRTFEKVSDWVDGFLDHFDGRGEDASTNFDDFDGFDLNDMSKFSPP